jgi:hypothetical protein
MANLGLDIAGGAKLAASERFGDWYRDPWGWPELSPTHAGTLDAEQDLGLRAGDDGEYHLGVQPHFHLIDIPKSRLGVRPAVVQDPLTRLAYLAAVQSVLPKLHDDLPEWVFGWRARGGESVVSGPDEWTAYVDSLPSAKQEGFGLVTDLTSFFASIRPDRLEPVVFGRLGKVAAAHVIMDVVRAHDSLSTRSGLPQRSFASAVLAHTFVKPVDDALQVSIMSGGVTAVRRWMDDISAEGDEKSLYVLLLELQERARQIGLEINAAKTSLGEASETASTLRLEDLKQIHVPLKQQGGDYEAVTFEPDLEVLHKIEDAILAQPGKASRTVARAVLVSLTEQGDFVRYLDWLGAAPALPHVADNLGRYLRAAGQANPDLWPFFGHWFAHFAASAWARLDWVVSQFALTFPADGLPEPVAEVLRHWLEDRSTIQQVAIATQRICAATPVVGRTLIRARVDRTSDPLILRALALGLLAAGEGREAVEPILRRDPRNGLLVRTLDATKWKPPTVAQDFDTSVTDG